MIKTKPRDIDEYIERFPGDTRKSLEELRAIIKKTVPLAEETISYGMPAFNLNGHYLVYFAAYKNHIGLYPVPGGNKEFEKDFAAYVTSGKGTIQFPLDKPVPLELVTKIVKFRVKENEEKAGRKKITKQLSRSQL